MILTTLLSVLSALSAKPANPWYVGLFRADNKFAKPPVCCPPVVRHTIYDTRRTTRTTRTRRTRRTRRTTNYTKTRTIGGQPIGENSSSFFYLYIGRTDHTHSSPPTIRSGKMVVSPYAPLSHRNAPVSRSASEWTTGAERAQTGRTGRSCDALTICVGSRKWSASSS